MKKIFQSHGMTVVLLVIVSVCLFATIYPEIFFAFKTSFVGWSDYCVEYAPSFILTNFLYQGGVQLWDLFGQMPYFHTYATLGLFKLPNLITAFSYWLLAPFAEDSAALFHHVFAWAQLMTLLSIRAMGIYLLLGTVTKNRMLTAGCAVIFAVFFCPSAFLIGVFYRSYFPLQMYFIVRFFQTLKMRYLAGSCLFFIVVLGSEILHAGYLYLPIHFFIIACVIWRIFFCPVRAKDFFKGWSWKTSRWIILAAVLVLAPYAYIVKFGFSDLFFGQSESRIGHPFNPYWYFHGLQLALSSPGAFFPSFLNFTNVDNNYYIGISLFFLALTGLVFSRNTVKWAFAITIGFLWLLTFPKESFNLGTPAHLINALTNPLKALPRSYFNAFQAALPYLLMPLAVLGMEAMREVFKDRAFSRRRIAILGFLLLALIADAAAFVPASMAMYLFFSAACLWGCLAFIFWRRMQYGKWMVGLLCFFISADIVCIIDQSKKSLLQDFDLKPVSLEAAPQAGLVEVDFENPSIFPFRNSTIVHFSFKDEMSLWWPHSVSSDFHHVINQGLNYVWVNGYNPRHIQFAGWMNDPQMLEYLKQNNEFISLMPIAIKASSDALGSIARAGLAKQVVEVEDPQGILQLPGTWPANFKNNEAKFRYSRIEGSLEDGEGRSSAYYSENGMIIYRMSLPPDFPRQICSSWFLPEQKNLRFFIERNDQWQELQEAEGALIRPGTFDVQNIKQGELRAAFSRDDFPVHHRCVLLYPSSENPGVVGLWRRQFDNLGIVYRAEASGWLVCHYPFDTKFKISVDGRPVTFYRVNESFIGFPISAGKHRILISYWPHALLRVLLFLSGLLTTAGLIALIVLPLRWEQKNIDG